MSGSGNQEIENSPDCPSYNDATSLVPPPYTPRSDLPENSDPAENASEPSTEDPEQGVRGNDIPVNTISIGTNGPLGTGTLPTLHNSMSSKKVLQRLYENIRRIISNAGPKSYALFGLWFLFFVYAVTLIVVSLINIKNCPAYVIMPPFLAVSGFLLAPFMITLLFKPKLFQRHTRDKISMASSILLSAFLLNSTVQTGIPWELMNLASREQVIDYDPSNIYIMSKSTQDYGTIFSCDKLTYGLAFTVGIVSHVNILLIVLTAVLGCCLCCCCSSWLDTRPRLQLVRKN